MSVKEGTEDGPEAIEVHGRGGEVFDEVICLYILVVYLLIVYLKINVSLNFK